MRHVFYYLSILIGFATVPTTAFSANQMDMDINNDGGITVVEAILSQQKRFHHIDTNGDNQLTLEEVTQFVENSGSDKEPEDYRRSFGRMDVSRNQSLSKLEFLEGIENRFSIQDKNNDNIITSNEMGR